MNWTEVRDLFRSWRDENVRKSQDIIDLWESSLQAKSNKLGDERYVVLEQVCIAALDCYRLDIASDALRELSIQFPSSQRIYRLQAMKLIAMERYDEAQELLDSIVKRDETNPAPRKLRITVLKARGRTTDAIKELTEYLKKFMSDGEAWQELCEMYLGEHEYGRAAFCLEELILHSPHNHLLHQRFAEIKYTQGGFENMELARAHYCLAFKLNQNNMRALYGIFLTATNIAMSSKCTSPKKKAANKMAAWAMKQIAERYDERATKGKNVTALQGLISTLQITST